MGTVCPAPPGAFARIHSLSLSPSPWGHLKLLEHPKPCHAWHLKLLEHPNRGPSASTTPENETPKTRGFGGLQRNSKNAWVPRTSGQGPRVAWRWGTAPKPRGAGGFRGSAGISGSYFAVTYCITPRAFCERHAKVARTPRERHVASEHATRSVGGRDRAERDAMKEGNGDLFKTRKGVLLDCWILN